MAKKPRGMTINYVKQSQITTFQTQLLQNKRRKYVGIKLKLKRINQTD